MTAHSDPPAPEEFPELSAIVLCYRAEEAVVGLIETLHAELHEEGLPFEIVLVANYDAGGGDRTPEIARSFAKSHQHVRVVARPKEGAMGWDMRSGLAAAQGRYLLVIDGDGQNPPTDVLRMYREMRSTRADVMKGRRSIRRDSLLRTVFTIVYNVLFRVFFGTSSLWDINGKPKGLTREAFERLDLRSDDWFVDAEIVLNARRLGLRIGELPVAYRESARESFVRPGAVAEFVRNMLRYRFRGPP